MGFVRGDTVASGTSGERAIRAALVMSCSLLGTVPTTTGLLTVAQFPNLDFWQRQRMVSAAAPAGTWTNHWTDANGKHLPMSFKAVAAFVSDEDFLLLTSAPVEPMVSVYS